MRTDSELKADLMERLDALPALSASDIQVSVDNGQVILTGEVDNRQTRFQVERTARRVAGLRGLQVNIRPGQGSLRKGQP